MRISVHLHVFMHGKNSEHTKMKHKQTGGGGCTVFICTRPEAIKKSDDSVRAKLKERLSGHVHKNQNVLLLCIFI